MARKLLLCSVRVFILIAVSVSVLLYIHYLAPAQTGLCGGASGCESVRRSGMGYFFGNPYLNMPLVGGVGFAGLFCLTLGNWRRRLVWLRWLFALTGVAAIGLVLLQVVYIGALCWLCMVVDGSAVLAALACLLIPLDRQPAPQFEGLRLRAWLTLLGLGLALPALWLQLKPPLKTPASILAVGQPGKVNIVEFADFECPYCRDLHPVLARVVARHRESVNFVQLHMPLPKHTYANDAARAAVCAELAGHGAEMAERLFEGELDPPSIAGYAKELGLETTGFDTCQGAPSTQARIDRDIALLREADFQGLPTTYVGGQRIIGLAAEEAFEEAVAQELSGGGRQIPSFVFAILSAIAVLAAVRLGLVRSVA